jgi:hypothetical protein
MSLEDKIINPVAPAGLPGPGSEPLPKAGKKRRKSGSTGAAASKAKKNDLEDEIGGDSTAVLTLEQPRRPQKKMLFESAAGDGTLAFAGPTFRPKAAPPAVKTPAPVATAPALEPQEAIEPTPVESKAEPVPAAAEAETLEPVAPELAAETASIEETAAATLLEAKAQTTDAAAIAAMKSSVFEVATLAMPEPEPEPQLEAATDEAEPELPLAIEPAAVGEDSLVVAPAVEAKNEEPFSDSLMLAFDGTLADGLAERAADAADVAPPAETPVAVEAPSKAPAIEPAPAAIAAAPAIEAPKPEPKPASEPASRTLSRSEAIAARLSARTPARPVPTAAETLAAARTAQQQARSSELPKHPGDIYGYWTRVKNGRKFPSRADFDAEQVAEHWPNSMLLTCSGGGGTSYGNFSSVLRLGANHRTRPGEDLNFTSMITEWILATGGEAVRAGAPVQDTEVFPTPDGTHAYKIVALPLSENQTRVDHVLCHLSRS